MHTGPKAYKKKRWREILQEWRTPILVALSAFLLYLRTLAPDVFVSDFAEFQYQPAVLGLPHPNGFPFYMLLGWVWHFFPLGEMAWRMNLLSAIGGSLASGLVAHFVQRISKQEAVGFLAGVLLALTPTFWTYSLIAERYTLNITLIIGAVWLAWEAGATPCDYRLRRLIASSALMLGIGLATHPSDVLLVPFWLTLLLWRTRTRLHWSHLSRLFFPLALPMVLYLYVPWRWAHFSRWTLLPDIHRSSAVYKGLVHVWYKPSFSWRLIFGYIAGLKGYASGLILGGWWIAVKQLSEVWPFFQQELSWAGIAIAVIGFFRLWRRERVLSMLLAAFIIFLTLMTAYIHQGKNDAYLLPSFGILLFFAAFAFMLPENLPTNIRLSLQKLQLAQWLLVLGLGFILLVLRYPKQDMSRELALRLDWEAVLSQPIENQAGLLGHWSDLTPLWYLQHTHDIRTDLWGLFPPTETQIINPWLRAKKPLYLAATTHGWAPTLSKDYNLIPWGKLVRILPRESKASCQTQLHLPLESDGPIAFGIQTLPAILYPYDTYNLSVCWQALKELPRQTFIGVRLTPENKISEPIEFHSLLASQWYPLDSIEQGVEGLSVVPLQLPVGATPGHYQAELILFYFAGDNSVQSFPDFSPISMGEITIAPTHVFKRSHLANETVPIIAPHLKELNLMAWHVSEGPVRPGDPVRLDLIWKVRKPLQQPLSLQVRFWGRGDRGLLSPPQPLFEESTIRLLQPGDVIRTIHHLNAPVGTGDHHYLIEVRIAPEQALDSSWQMARIIVGTIMAKDRPHYWKPHADMSPVTAQFGDIALLTGYRATFESSHPEKTLKVDLAWQAIHPDECSYKVFIHVIALEGEELASQHDGYPANEQIPTNLWIENEYIEDTHEIILPENLLPGRYSIRIGMYDPSSGVRIPVTATSPVIDNAVEIIQLTIDSR